MFANAKRLIDFQTMRSGSSADQVPIDKRESVSTACSHLTQFFGILKLVGID